MHTNLEVKPVDVVILIVLAIMFVLAIKIIISFLKKINIAVRIVGVDSDK